MSHFTYVRTKLRDIQTVKQALEDLGYTVETGAVRGHAGQAETSDLVVRTESGYDVGFRQTGEIVEMVADFCGLPFKREEFVEKVTQRYAYLTVLEKTTQDGWQVAAEEVQADGSIRLVMQRWE